MKISELTKFIHQILIVQTKSRRSMKKLHSYVSLLLCVVMLISCVGISPPIEAKAYHEQGTVATAKRLQEYIAPDKSDGVLVLNSSLQTYFKEPNLLNAQIVSSNTETSLVVTYSGGTKSVATFRMYNGYPALVVFKSSSQTEYIYPIDLLRKPLKYGTMMDWLKGYLTEKGVLANTGTVRYYNIGDLYNIFDDLDGAESVKGPTKQWKYAISLLGNYTQLTSNIEVSPRASVYGEVSDKLDSIKPQLEIYNNSYNVGETVILTAPEVAGFSFNSWDYLRETYPSGAYSTGMLSREKSYSLSIPSKNYKIFCNYSPNTYTLSFNSNGGLETFPSRSIEYTGYYGDVEEDIILPTPTREGYRFVGWEDTDGKIVTETDCYYYIGDSTLTAKWEGYEMVLNMENLTPTYGIFTDISGLHKTGDLLNLNATPNTGFEFEGWYISYERETNKTKISNIARTTYNMPALDSTIYAKFKGKAFKLSFNSNGGTYQAPKVIEYKSNYGPLPEPTREGYKFLGWYDGEFQKDAQDIYNYQTDSTLLAKWEPLLASVTINNLNPTFGAISNTGGLYYTDEDINLVATPNPGYEFEGWYIGSDKISSSTSYTHIMGTNALTIDAKFKPKTYTINFNTVGGTTVNSRTIEYNSTYGSLPTTTKKGFTFEGWYDPISKKTVSTSTVYTNVGDITLNALWSYNTYNLNIINKLPEAGTVSTSSGSYEYEEEVILQTTVNPGYTFNGWWDVEDLSMISLSNPYTYIMEDSPIDIEAEFKANKYTVSFNSNGGSAVGEKEVTFNSTYGALPTPTKTGYTFNGWNTPLGVQITSTSKYKTVGNITLTAQWVANKYTVSFNSNGGSTVGDIQVTYNSAYGTLPTPTRTGYTFSGWENTSKVLVNGGTLYTLTSNSTLTARWTANQYTVSFNSNGGSICTSITVTYDSNYGTLPTPTRNGYTFNGWKDSSSTTVTSASKYTTASASTLTAQWTANTYTITFNSNGGTTVANRDIVFGSTYGTLPTPTRTGYTLTGWKDSSSNTIIATTVYNTIGNTTLTAQWTANTYKVSFNSNGGSICSDINVTYNSAYGTLPIPTRTGYTFNGWKNGGGTIVTQSTIYSTASNSTLTADWTINKYNVVFNSNGGSAVGNIQVTYNSAYGTLPSPTRTGYTFNGWRDSGNNVITSASIHSITTDITLTAQWTINKFTVRFLDATGSVFDTQLVEYGKDAVAPSTNPTKVGYTFTGWSSYANITSTRDITPSWKANSYKVTFNPNIEGNVTNYVLSAEEMTVTYDSTLNSLATITRDGYNFLGWYLKDGTKISGSVMKQTSDFIVYAKWEAKTVNYNVKAFMQRSDGTFGGTNVGRYTATVGTKFSLATLGQQVFDGYTFNYDLTVKANESLKEYSNGTMEIWGDGQTTINLYYKKNTFDLYENYLLSTGGGGLIFMGQVTPNVERTRNVTKFRGYGSPTMSIQYGKVTNISKLEDGYTFKYTTSEIDTTLVYSYPVLSYKLYRYDALKSNSQTAIASGVYETVPYFTQFDMTYPEKRGYTFDRWVLEPVNEPDRDVTDDWLSVYDYAFTSKNSSLYMPYADVTIGYLYHPNQHTLTVKRQYNDAKLNTLIKEETVKTETVDFDSTITVNDFKPVGYTLTGYKVSYSNGDFTNYSATDSLSFIMDDYDVEVVCLYDINYYTVRMLGRTGNVLETASYPHGTTANTHTSGSPTFTITSGVYKDTSSILVPTESGYTFTKWNNNSNITSNTDVTSTWTTNQYKTDVTTKQVLGSGSPDILKTTGTVTQNYNTSVLTTLTKHSDIEGYTYRATNIYKVDSDGTETLLGSFDDTTQYVTRAYNVKIEHVYDIKTFNVKFLGLDGELLGTVITRWGFDAIPISNPIHEGVTFKSWSDYTNIKSDRTVTSTWDYLSYKVIVNQIKMDDLVSSNGTYTKEYTFRYREPIVLTEVPSIVGFKFDKYIVDGIEMKDLSYNTPSKNITVSLVYNILRYKVDFLDYDGSIFETQQVKYAYDAIPPVNTPTKTGYTFAKWGDYSNIIDDRTVFSNWKSNKYNINVIIDAEEQEQRVSATAIVSGNFDTTVTTVHEVIEGYNLVGWEITQNGVVEKIPSTTNVSFKLTDVNAKIVAKYNLNIYKVTYLNRLGGIFTEKNIKHGYPFENITITEDGYTFISWSDTSNITSNRTVTSNWVGNAHTISIDDVVENANGSTSIINSSLTGKTGDTLSIEKGSAEGHTHSYWKVYKIVNAKRELINQIPSNEEGKIDLLVDNYDYVIERFHKINSFTVNFLDSTGATFTTQQVKWNETAIVPSTNPIKTGYTLTGWSDYTKITSTRNIVPYWKANTYKITFNPNAQGNIKDYVLSDTEMNVTYDSVLNNLATITRTGYTFEGWFLENGNKLSGEIMKIDGNVEVFAKWSPKSVQYTVDTYLQNADGSYTKTYTAKHSSNSGTIIDLKSKQVNEYPGYTYDWELTSEKSKTSSGYLGTTIEVWGDSSTVISEYYKKNSFGITVYRKLGDRNKEVLKAENISPNTEVTEVLENVRGFGKPVWDNYLGELKLLSTSTDGYTFRYQTTEKLSEVVFKYPALSYKIYKYDAYKSDSSSAISGGIYETQKFDSTLNISYSEIYGYTFERWVITPVDSLDKVYLDEWLKTENVDLTNKSLNFKLPACDFTIGYKYTPNNHKVNIINQFDDYTLNSFIKREDVSSSVNAFNSKVMVTPNSIKGYTLVGYEVTINNVVKKYDKSSSLEFTMDDYDAKVVCLYSINYYTVTLLDRVGSTIKTMSIPFGTTANLHLEEDNKFAVIDGVYVDNGTIISPTEVGYTFTSWNNNTNIDSNRDITSNWNINKYKTQTSTVQIIGDGIDSIITSTGEVTQSYKSEVSTSFTKHKNIEGYNYKETNVYKVDGGVKVLLGKFNDNSYGYLNNKDKYLTEAYDVLFEHVYEIQKFSVRFLGLDGEVLGTVETKWGFDAIPIATPTHEGVTFKSWSDYTNIKSNRDVTSTWEYLNYTVNIKQVKNDEGTLSETTYKDTLVVTYRNNVSSVTVPDLEGFVFSGYKVDGGGLITSLNFNMPARNVTVELVYNILDYKVDFLNHDGTVFSTQRVKYNYNAIQPSSNPVREGYTFIGWESYNNIKSNSTIQPKWKANGYYVNLDINITGNVMDYVLSTDSVKIDFDSVITGLPIPTRTGYSFDGWFTERTGGTNIEGTKMDSILGKQVYAHWSPKSVNYKLETYLQQSDGTYKKVSESNNMSSSGTILNYKTMPVNIVEGYTYSWELTGKASEGVIGYSDYTMEVWGDSSTIIKLYYEKNLFNNVVYKQIDNNSMNIIEQLNYAPKQTFSIVADVMRGYSIPNWSVLSGDLDLVSISEDGYTATYTKKEKDSEVLQKYTTLEYKTYFYDARLISSEDAINNGIYTNKVFNTSVSHSFEKNGYNFDNWVIKPVNPADESYLEDWLKSTDLNSEQLLFNMPACDITIGFMNSPKEVNYKFTDVIVDSQMSVILKRENTVEDIKHFDDIITLNPDNRDDSTFSKFVVKYYNGSVLDETKEFNDNKSIEITLDNRSIVIERFYTVNYYKVNFLDRLGEVIQTYELPYGLDANMYKDNYDGLVIVNNSYDRTGVIIHPTEVGYTFTGWNENTFINSDRDITSNWSINQYETLTETKQVISEDDVLVESTGKVSQDYNSKVSTSFTKHKEIEGYSYISTEVYKVDGDDEILLGNYNDNLHGYLDNKDFYTTESYNVKLVHVYNINTFNVKFFGLDGELLGTVVTRWGFDAIPIEDPTHDGVKFIGWSDYTNIKSDRDVTSNWEYLNSSVKVNLILLDTKETLDSSFNADIKYREALSIDVPEIYGYTLCNFRINGQYTDSLDGKVLEDSNTTIDIIYTINSYNVNFLNHDGSILDSKLVKYNYKQVNTDLVPSRIGYTFDEWEDVGSIVNDTDIHPTWKANDYQFKVIISAEELEDRISEVSVVSGAFDSVLETRHDTLDGYHLVGWDIEQNGIKDSVESTSDVKFKLTDVNAKIVAKYKLNEYTVTYLDRLDKVFATEIIKHGKPFVNLDITSDGYIFKGWDDTSTVYSDRTVKSIWIGNSHKLTITDLIENSDGSITNVSKDSNIKTGDSLVINSGDVEGHTLMKWNVYKINGNGKELIAEVDPTKAGSFILIIEDNDYIVERVQKINSYTVTFLDEGSVVETQTVKWKENAKVPKALTKDGFTFKGWEDCTKITSDRTVNALWSGTGLKININEILSFNGVREKLIKQTQFRALEGNKLIWNIGEFKGFNYKSWKVLDNEGRLINKGTGAVGDTLITEISEKGLTLNVYYEAKDCKVTYKFEGKVIGTEIVKFGGKGSVPKVEGYELDAIEWSGIECITSDNTIIEGKVKDNIKTIQTFISLDNEGKPVQLTLNEFNALLNLEGDDSDVWVDPYMNEWDIDDAILAGVDLSTLVKKNKLIYADGTTANISSLNVRKLDTFKVAEGSKVSMSCPFFSGYSFKGWYDLKTGEQFNNLNVNKSAKVLPIYEKNVERPYVPTVPNPEVTPTSTPIPTPTLSPKPTATPLPTPTIDIEDGGGKGQIVDKDKPITPSPTSTPIPTETPKEDNNSVVIGGDSGANNNGGKPNGSTDNITDSNNSDGNIIDNGNNILDKENNISSEVDKTEDIGPQYPQKDFTKENNLIPSNPEDDIIIEILSLPTTEYKFVYANREIGKIITLKEDTLVPLGTVEEKLIKDKSEYVNSGDTGSKIDANNIRDLLKDLNNEMTEADAIKYIVSLMVNIGVAPTIDDALNIINTIMEYPNIATINVSLDGKISYENINGVRCIMVGGLVVASYSQILIVFIILMALAVVAVFFINHRIQYTKRREGEKRFYSRAIN